MTDSELTALIRSVAARLEAVGTRPEGVGFDEDVEVRLARMTESVPQIVATLRAVPGIYPNVHCGTNPAEFTPRMTLEWYAGSLLDIVDKQGWFAVNSWLNCLDKFAPEMADQAVVADVGL